MSPSPSYIGPALAVVAGVMLFAALHHLFIGLRRPHERVYLFFAAVSVSAAVWAAWGIPLYSAATPDAFIHATRWRQASGLVIGPCLIWFVAEYTEVKPKAFLWTSTAVQLGLLVVDLVLPFTLYYSGPPALEFHLTPWGELLTEASGPRGALFIPTVITNTFNFLFGLWASGRMWRRGERAQALPLLLVLGFILLGLFRFLLPVFGPVPTAEIGFLGLVLVMSVTVSNRVVEAAHMREALAESELRLRTLVETAPEAVLLLDCDTGRALEANEHALTLFGVDRKGLPRLQPSDHAPPEQEGGEPSLLVFEQHMREALNGGLPVFRWVVRVESEDVPCEARLVLLPGSDPAMVRLSLTDIRVLEASEVRQRELEAQLHRSQRMEALGRLTGGVAHDFNNLLTVIRGNLGLLQEGGTPAEVGELVGQALAATGRAAELIQRLLAFSRRQTLAPRRVEVVDAVRAVVEMLRRPLGEEVHLEVDVPDDVSPLVADPAQLESALVNLAINARDAMPNGGHIRIEARNVVIDAEGRGWIEPFVEGAYVAVTVRDDGRGMDREVRTHALDPFFTTKEVGRGSGLGLAVVYGFVTQSGGSVALESVAGEGTAVHLLFPVHRD